MREPYSWLCFKQDIYDFVWHWVFLDFLLNMVWGKAMVSGGTGYTALYRVENIVSDYGARWAGRDFLSVYIYMSVGYIHLIEDFQAIVFSMGWVDSDVIYFEEKRDGGREQFFTMPPIYVRVT